MHDDIVRHLPWQERYLVIEIEIASLRTASPTSFLILDRDLVP